MSYQVLARKYRPQSFEEAIGQEPATRTLKNAIAQQRLHHAYLFTGPRGVGKTSLARIFAKCINCEKGPTTAPCQACTPCEEITAGSSMDVQEIDGASNTSVDDIRSLRENAKYTPGSGRYKIYIIDEVHMLSKSAFAALLKTLEEPPDHVRFIFATTDPEKIPATILSRVLRFDFRRPSTELLLTHLERIAADEKIDVPREALLWIARQAEGSVRDSLSLFDRVISFAGDKITEADVLQALGISGRNAVLQLLDHVITRNTEGALQFVNDLYNEGQDIKQFGQDLMEAIRDVLVFKVTGDKGFSDWSQGEKDAVQQLASKSEIDELEYLFHLFHRAYREILYSPLPRVLLEITVMRLCTRHDRQPLADVIARLDSIESGPASQSQRTSPQTSTAKQTPPSSGSSNPWEQFLNFVERKKPALAAVLAQARWDGEIDGRIQLGYPPQAAHRTLLQDPARQQILAQLGQEFFKKEIIMTNGSAAPVSTNPEQTEAENSIIDEAIAIFKPTRTEMEKR